MQSDQQPDLRSLVREHRGNLTSIAAVLGVSRQAATGHLKRAGLTRAAAKARMRAANAGPLLKLTAGQRNQEARRLRAAIRRWGMPAAFREVARHLGWSARTVARRTRALGIGIILTVEVKPAPPPPF
jgi:DNA-binding NtrC family response regulator